MGQGGPPMITDDPGTVDKAHFEINSGITIEHTKSETTIEFPFADINYGVSKRQHINFEVPLVSRYVKGFGKQTGIGKVGIGSKIRFIDSENAGIDISTHPAVYFVVSGEAVSKEVIDGGTEIFIPVEFQKDFKKNILGVEIGRKINLIGGGDWEYGVLYGREFNARINAAVEINGSSDRKFNQNAVFFNFGSRMRVSKRYILLFSAGQSIVLPKTSERIFIGYLAVQISI